MVAIRAFTTTLSLVLALAWSLWIGLARPLAVIGPAGDASICLALALRASLGWPAALVGWAVVSLWSSVVGGVAWFWILLGGWPAWLLSQPPRGKSVTAHLSYLATAAGLITLTRTLLKLGCGRFLQGEGLLTLSGAGLIPSFWAELLCNLGLLCALSLIASACAGERRD